MSADKRRPRKSLLAGEGDIEQLRRAYSQWEDVQRVFAALDETRADVTRLTAELQHERIWGKHDELEALQAKLDEAGAENERLRARAAGLEKAFLKAGGHIITYTLPRVGTPETGDDQ